MRDFCLFLVLQRIMMQSEISNGYMTNGYDKTGSSFLYGNIAAPVISSHSLSRNSNFSRPRTKVSSHIRNRVGWNAPNVRFGARSWELFELIEPTTLKIIETSWDYEVNHFFPAYITLPVRQKLRQSVTTLENFIRVNDVLFLRKMKYRFHFILQYHDIHTVKAT